MHVFGQLLNLIKLTHHLCLFNINITLQRSWSTANAKQREKLLELIRRLAEDDKDGVMADKGKHFQTLLFYLKNIKNLGNLISVCFLWFVNFYFTRCTVLTLFWNLAHSSDVSIEIMDQALSAHVKILDYR